MLGLAALALPVAGVSGAVAAELYGVAQDGRDIAAGDIRGWRLVYFGYTRCPDICPTSLQAMALALDALGPIGARITPVFVTVDPERDTPKAMADYVSFFSPRFVALSPKPGQLPELAKAWRVVYKRVETKNRGDYLMDHTATIFLADPSGAVKGRFPHDLDGRTLAERIRAAILKD